MHTIQAVVSDLDDTLLTVDHRLSDRTLQTLRRIQLQGVKVILASGRSAASMRPIVGQAGVLYPYIAYNGAQIVDPKTHEVLASSEIPRELAREALKWFEARGIYTQYYQGDDWFYAEPSQIADEYGKSSGIPGTLAGEKLSTHITEQTAKLLAIADEGLVQQLLPQARAAFGDRLSVTTSKPHFIEITSPGATKGNAIGKLADMIGLAPETTICAGDSLNDLSMLAWSRMPVTVENAREEVKRVAWRIAGNGHQDGLAILLDALIPEVN